MVLGGTEFPDCPQHVEKRRRGRYFRGLFGVNGICRCGSWRNKVLHCEKDAGKKRVSVFIGLNIGINTLANTLIWQLFKWQRRGSWVLEKSMFLTNKVLGGFILVRANSLIVSIIPYTYYNKMAETVSQGAEWARDNAGSFINFIALFWIATGVANELPYILVSGKFEDLMICERWKQEINYVPIYRIRRD